MFLRIDLIFYDMNYRSIFSCAERSIPDWRPCTLPAAATSVRKAEVAGSREARMAWASAYDNFCRMMM